MKNAQHLAIVSALLLVACGPRLSKSAGGEPSNGATNNGTGSTNVATNGATTGTNNATIAPNNASTNNTTVGPTNNTVVIPTNNATNNATNNMTVDGLRVVFVPGEFGDFGTKLVAEGLDFELVGGDTAPLLQELARFVATDLETVDVLIVDQGSHMLNFTDSVGRDALVMTVQTWVEDGGRLVDLSGGITGRAWPNFWGSPLAVVAAGSYTAIATDGRLPQPVFVFDAPQLSMAYLSPEQLTDPGEWSIAESDVVVCDLMDFTCADPENRTTAVIAGAQLGAGVAFFTPLAAPLTPGARDALFALIELPLPP